MASAGATTSSGYSNPASSRIASIRDGIETMVWCAGRVLRLPPRSMLTTVRVAALMALVEVMVRRLPLPRIADVLKVQLDLRPSASAAEPLNIAALPAPAQRQIECTNRVANVWPFSNGPCLRRTLVAGRLLRRFDPSIRLGLRGTTSAGGDMVAHAWLEIDGQPLEDVTDVGAFAISGTT